MRGRELLDFDYVEWDDPGDLRGNLEHIAAAGLTPEEVEDVLYAPDPDADTSDGTGRPVVFGTTSTGKYIIVVYDRTEENNVVVIRPVTAYEVDPPL
jgi:uncharacterized DUF497 family protein